jgi:hypothetical protein
MPFPRIFDDLVSFGYKFLDHAVCRDCGEEIEWWQTPNNKKMPINHKDRGSDPVEVHFETCSEKK